MDKNVQIYITKLLTLFKTKFGKNVILTIGDDERLWLWIPIGKIHQSIIFDEDYPISMSPTECFETIISELKKGGYSV